MNTQLTFRIVRYTPAPEFIEPVNIAILIIDRRPRLILDSSFPKLSCAVPRCNLEPLRFLLEWLDAEVRECTASTAHLRITQHSSQMQVSDEKTLTRGITRDLEGELIGLYLKRHTRTPDQTERRIYIDTLLDRVVETELGLRHVQMLKRASPQDFLSSSAYDHLRSNGFKISRVISGTQKLILMDGINLQLLTGNYLRTRTQEIGYAFFAMGSIKRELPQLESRELIRASFVFNRETADLDPKSEYLLETLNRDSDLRIDPHLPEDRNRLRELIITADRPDLSLL